MLGKNHNGAFGLDIIEIIPWNLRHNPKVPKKSPSQAKTDNHVASENGEETSWSDSLPCQDQASPRGSNCSDPLFPHVLHLKREGGCSKVKGLRCFIASGVYEDYQVSPKQQRPSLKS